MRRRRLVPAGPDEHREQPGEGQNDIHGVRLVNSCQERSCPPATAGQHTVKLARRLYSGRIARVLREAIVDGETLVAVDALLGGLDDAGRARARGGNAMELFW